MPTNKSTPRTTATQPSSAKPSSAKPPKLSLKDLEELRTAEEQAAAEDAERKEHDSVIGAVALEPAPETTAPSDNQAAYAASTTPSRVKATKVAREAIWYRLTKREQLPLAKTEKDEGLVLSTSEEDGDAYVFVTCRLIGDNRDDDMSRAVDRYQTALEKYGIASERVMRDLRPHLRVKVTRTDADVHTPGKRPSALRSAKRLADDDQYQTGDGMGI